MQIPSLAPEWEVPMYLCGCIGDAAVLLFRGIALQFTYGQFTLFGSVQPSQSPQNIAISNRSTLQSLLRSPA